MQKIQTSNGKWAVIHSDLPDYLEIKSFDPEADNVTMTASRSTRLLLSDLTKDRKLLGVYCLSPYPYDDNRALCGSLLNPSRIFMAYYDLENDRIASERISWPICQLAFERDYTKILFALQAIRAENQEAAA